MAQKLGVSLDEMREPKNTFTVQEKDVLDTLEEMIVSSSKIMEFLMEYKRRQSIIYQELLSIQPFTPSSRIDGDYWKLFCEQFLYSVEAASSEKSNYDSILLRLEIIKQKLIDLKQEIISQCKHSIVQHSDETKILEIQKFSSVNMDNINHFIDVFKKEIFSLCFSFMTNKFDSKFDECHQIQRLRLKFQSLLKDIRNKSKTFLNTTTFTQQNESSGSIHSADISHRINESDLNNSPISLKSIPRKPLPQKPDVKFKNSKLHTSPPLKTFPTIKATKNSAVSLPTVVIKILLI